MPVVLKGQTATLAALSMAAIAAICSVADAADAAAADAIVGTNGPATLSAAAVPTAAALLLSRRLA